MHITKQKQKTIKIIINKNSKYDWLEKPNVSQ